MCKSTHCVYNYTLCVKVHTVCYFPPLLRPFSRRFHFPSTRKVPPKCPTPPKKKIHCLFSCPQLYHTTIEHSERLVTLETCIQSDEPEISAPFPGKRAEISFSARTEGVGGRVDFTEGPCELQSWQCQDFERFHYVRSSLTRVSDMIGGRINLIL